ncbi:MAG TPA: aspartyl protease family protein [Puia sp.]|nr:aspartyl protease family protein [Puia sp.]
MDTPTKLARRLVVFVLLGGLLGGPARGQRNRSLSPDRFLTTIPFTVLNGGIVLGKVQLDSFPDSLNFIFDTGCGGVSLDSTTAVAFGLKPITSPLFVRGIAGELPQRLVGGRSLSVGGIRLDSLTLQVNNYDLLSSVYGIKIDGILGYAFYSRYVVTVNYDSSKMYVYTPGPVRYPRGGYLLHPRLYGLPMLEGRLADGRDISDRFYFDTGAGLCLLFSSDFTADSAVFGPKRKKPLPTQGAGLGGKADMQLTTLRTFSLGPFHFRKVPTYIFNDSFGVTSYPQLGGLIGNDLLRRFNLIVNYARSEIYLVPNSAYNQPFDYSYTGLSIGLIDGRVMVTDVMPGSPAAKAGLLEGDIILMINGDGKQDVQTYQNLLRTIGPKVKVLVRHNNGELVMLEMKVCSIL